MSPLRPLLLAIGASATLANVVSIQMLINSPLLIKRMSKIDYSGVDRNTLTTVCIPHGLGRRLTLQGGQYGRRACFFGA